MTSTAPIAIQNPWLIPPPSAEPPALSERLIRALEAHAAAEAHDVALLAALPVPSDAPSGDPAAVATLRELIRDQHEGARYVRHLARQEPALYDGLYATLLETIGRDSEKHATVLRFLLLRFEERRR